MNVSAKFIGKSSLGFKHGDVYDLDMFFTFTQGKKEGGVYISNGKGLQCEYSRVVRFIDNWEVLTINHLNEKEKKFAKLKILRIFGYD